MRTLSIDKKEYSIPGKWNELGKEDLLEYCRIQLTGMDEVYQRLMLLKYFTQLSFKEIEALPNETLPDILEIFDYLYQESKLTINHFKEINFLKGPDDALTDLTFEQYFGEAEQYSYMFIVYKNSDYLLKLIEVLYNFEKDETKSKAIKKLDEQVKLAIFLFYQGSSNFIKKKFSSIFSKTESIEQSDGLEFLRMVNNLNHGDISKNEAIKKTNLYEALTHLEKLIKESKK